MSCDEYNAVLHKDAAIAILEITLAAEAEYAERLEKQVAPQSLSCQYSILLILPIRMTRLLKVLKVPVASSQVCYKRHSHKLSRHC